MTKVITVKCKSLQENVDRLKETSTVLFKTLPVETVDTHEDIRFLGVTYSVDDGEDLAVTKLLTKLDDELFYGDPSQNEDKSIRGLCSVIGSDNYFHKNHYYQSRREEFYDRFEAEKERLGLRLFSPTDGEAIGEGDLPSLPDVFAIGKDALVWRQLLPCTSIPLLSLREGKPTVSIDGTEPKFKYEDSFVQNRACAVIYGQLRVVDPDAVFVLAGDQNR